MPQIYAVMDFPGVRPLCFNSDEDYLEWQRMAAIVAGANGQRAHYCIDCTPEFKQAMLTEGRCEHPETRFIEDRREVRGYRSAKELYTWKRSRQRHTQEVRQSA